MQAGDLTMAGSVIQLLMLRSPVMLSVSRHRPHCSGCSMPATAFGRCIASDAFLRSIIHRRGYDSDWPSGLARHDLFTKSSLWIDDVYVKHNGEKHLVAYLMAVGASHA
ncbi:unnamed protein product [Victoria cruziana]